MRRLLLPAFLVIPACHQQPASPPRETRQAQGSKVAVPRAAPGNSTQESAGADDAAADGADMLRHYYALIEAGRYGDAWRMRSGGRGIDAAQFAAHFKAYESYHSQVGTPSRPVRSNGWDYVEVPVMTTGRFLGGKPFGSAGSVTLRRPAPGTAAAPGEQGWRIYTG
jgi:hypothetical protein